MLKILITAFLTAVITIILFSSYIELRTSAKDKDFQEIKKLLSEKFESSKDTVRFIKECLEEKNRQSEKNQDKKSNEQKSDFNLNIYNNRKNEEKNDENRNEGRKNDNKQEQNKNVNEEVLNMPAQKDDQMKETQK